MKIKKLLDAELKDIRPSESEEHRIKELVDGFLERLSKKLKGAKAMVGGSFAKGTTIRKKRYDVDVFVIFEKDENISDILGKALKSLKIKADRLPGSRDYFSITMKNPDFKMEVVPVFRIKKAEDARNVTDVSILHVRYIREKIKKNPRLADEIRLAKAFCYGQDCYGAESHIRGFSGYCIEILTSHYGSFMNLMKSASKWKQKTVIDPEKYYKNESEIMHEINEAKLLSPLILIDPVQRNRNAAAAIDDEKFSGFINAAKNFLKKPSPRFFEKKEFKESKVRKDAKRMKFSLMEVDAESKRAKEDISGAKLLKLHRMIKKSFEKESYGMRDFWIFEKNASKSYFMLKKPKKIIQKGPPVERMKHADEFKKRWKKTFVKHGVLYAEREPKTIEKMLKVDKKILKEMGIDSFKVKRLL